MNEYGKQNVSGGFALFRGQAGVSQIGKTLKLMRVFANYAAIDLSVTAAGLSSMT
jgi:hypothetical protein